MDRHPFSIENILKDTRGAGSILKIAPTSEALALAERMAGKFPLFCLFDGEPILETPSVLSANSFFPEPEKELSLADV